MVDPLDILNILKKEYPDARTALISSTPWQMLVSTILSAQCTDKRVNLITKGLFKKYPSLEDYLSLTDNELIKFIRSAGFYRNKARNILLTAKAIKNNFNGIIPKTMDSMITLPGVARKTANVVLGHSFNIAEGIAVDTHVKRLSFRLGLTKQQQPDKIEKDLMLQIPHSKWIETTYLLIEHGRAVCKAPTPICSKCKLNILCPQKGVLKKH